jgi:hypothetical protein
MDGYRKQRTAVSDQRSARRSRQTEARGPRPAGRVCPELSGHRVARRILVLVILISLTLAVHAADRTCMIITGLGGVPEHEENFLRWTDQVSEFFGEELQADVIAVDGRKESRTEILERFESLSAGANRPSEFWLFLIGHGTFDGSQYKINVRGPDITGEDLDQFFEALDNTRIYLVAATSASGALLPLLSRGNRVILTATRSGTERQPPLFLTFLLQAMRSTDADTDKDGRVSLLEAFNAAQIQVSGWYQERKRIRTEHALLDDSGQRPAEEGSEPATGAGLLSASTYLGTEAGRAALPPALEEERARLEREIAHLRFRKREMDETEYFQQLEGLLVQLARIEGQAADGGDRE